MKLKLKLLKKIDVNQFSPDVFEVLGNNNDTYYLKSSELYAFVETISDSIDKTEN